LLFLFRSLDGNQLCGLNYRGQGTYTADGIIAITEMLKVNATLQSISVLGNCFNAESATAIVNAVQDKPQILTLCGIKPEDTECDFNTQGLGAGDAVLLAFDLRNNSALVKLDLAENRICYNGEMSGLTALCKMLKTNGSLRELKCVASCARFLTKREQPLTTCCDSLTQHCWEQPQCLC